MAETGSSSTSAEALNLDDLYLCLSSNLIQPAYITLAANKLPNNRPMDNY